MALVTITSDHADAKAGGTIPLIVGTYPVLPATPIAQGVVQLPPRFLYPRGVNYDDTTP